MGCGKTKVNDTVLKSQQAKTPNEKEIVSDIVIRSNLIRKPTKPFNEEYHNGNKIGTGGFAEVRRCTHKLTGMMRAVKIYYKNLFPQEYLNSGGLQQEIEIFKRLDHPNLVKVYEYFEDDKSNLLQTEIIIDLYEGQNDASMSNSLSDQGSIEANSDSHKINNAFDHSDANIEKVHHCDVTFKLIYNNK